MADNPLPVLERIARDVLATLTGLTLLGATNPDGSALALNVKRAKRKNSPRHLDAIIYQIAADRDGDEPLQTDQWLQGFAVTVCMSPLDTDPTPIDQYNNAAIASVYLAVMRDYTRGGLALDTIVRPPIYFPQDEGEYAGVTCLFDVRYRNAIDDPYALAVG